MTAGAPFHPGRLVMVDIEGRQLSTAAAEFLRRYHIRAVCLFRKNLGTESEVKQLTAQLRAVLGPQALIALDQEGGSVVRATFLPQAPSAMALGAAADAALAEQVGAAVARGVRSLGCNWNFAPVLDVNNNPANPVIGDRSFGANPVEVARLAGAWMRGALSERVACCVKHFPGHGDTQVDSHLDLPVVDKSEAELAALELLPFHALCQEAPAVMTAHIVYPQLDAEYPATLSQKILGQLLRGAWRYDGVLITDSLVMKAIYDRYGHQRAGVLALQAGADMVMALGAQQEQLNAIEAIGAALDRGTLSQQQVLRSNARLDALAARFPSSSSGYAPAQLQRDEQLMRDAWARGLTVLGAARPPPRDQQVRVITQRSVASDGVAEAGLPGARVAALFEGFDVRVDEVDELSALDWARVPRDGRFDVLVSNHRARYGTQARQFRPQLHLALWNPFQVLDVPAPAVVTWGYAEGAMEALRLWLLGRGDAPGRSPVQLVPLQPA